MLGGVTTTDVSIDLADDLRLFLSPRRRGGPLRVPADGDTSLGHLVESSGVPLPEVGAIEVDGVERAVSYRPRGGEAITVRAVPRPQAIPGGEPRFLLDVHLGALARRMRLVGLDTAYHNDCDDPVLVEQANAEHRVLLTQDRGLLHRRNLWLGAYVRGARADAQLDDVLGRFALPPLKPWTRCTACNGLLHDVDKDEVEDRLPRGTREAVSTFARCAACGQVYWHGAHGGRLDRIVTEAARKASAGRRPGA